MVSLHETCLQHTNAGLLHDYLMQTVDLFFLVRHGNYMVEIKKHCKPLMVGKYNNKQTIKAEILTDEYDPSGPLSNRQESVHDVYGKVECLCW